MIATSDCYVSLHRSLGLGSTIADAMALGVPVIATSYGGNLDYMDEHNSVLIPGRWTSVICPAHPRERGVGRILTSTSRQPRCAEWSTTIRRSNGEPRRHEGRF